MKQLEEKKQNNRALDEKVNSEEEKDRSKKNKTWDPNRSNSQNKHK